MKFYKKILIVLLVIVPFLILIPVKADSGWDSDYDSGGSWDSGSDWVSGSDWDYDDWDSDDDWSSSSSGSYNSSYSSGDASWLVTGLFLVIITIAIAYSLSGKRFKGNVKTTYDNNDVYYLNENDYNDVREDMVKNFLPDETLGSLKHMAYEKFVAIQNAWSEFDYDKLRELCTDELYNSYITQLDTLKLKNGKNVMNDFENLMIKVTSVKEEAGNIAVTIYLKARFYDYVINSTSGEVTRGTNERKLTNNYIMTFIKSKDAVESKCPNCGAPNKGNTSSTCEYCDSTIVTDAKDFVMSKKTNVNL